MRLWSADQALFLPLKMGQIWQTGQSAEAVVRRLQVAADGGGGFCEDAFGRTYFLKRTQGLFEGQHINIKILGEPRGTKPALAQTSDEERGLARLANTLAFFGLKQPIEVEGLELLKQARAAFPQDRFILADKTDEGELRTADDVLEGTDLQAGDARLIFETTQTAHLIDIDGQGSRSALNRQALPAVAQLIVERNLGGLIVVDFLPPATKQDRRDLAEEMAAALSPLPHRLKVHAMNESGHLLLERQRLGPEFLPSYYEGDL